MAGFDKAEVVYQEFDAGAGCGDTVLDREHAPPGPAPKSKAIVVSSPCSLMTGLSPTLYSRKPSMPYVFLTNLGVKAFCLTIAANWSPRQPVILVILSCVSASWPVYTIALYSGSLIDAYSFDLFERLALLLEPRDGAVDALLDRRDDLEGVVLMPSVMHRRHL